MGTDRSRKLVKFAVFCLLLLLVGGGAVVAGLPLSLLSSSQAHEYGGRDLTVAQAMLHPDVNTVSYSAMSEACRPTDMPYLGLTYLPVTEATAKSYSLRDAGGLLLTAVAGNSPASRAGLRINDVLLQFDNHPLGPDSSLVSILMSYQIGDSVPLIVMRQDEQKQIKLTLGKRPGN